MHYKHQPVLRKAVYELENALYINSGNWIKACSHHVTKYLVTIKKNNVTYIQLVI